MSKKPSVVKLPRLPADVSSCGSRNSGTNDKTALAVRRLRSRLLSLRQHPIYGPKIDTSTSALLKWLKVSGNDVFAADGKIRRSLELKEKMKVESLVNHTIKVPQILRSGYPGGVCGEDREGSPVYYELCGLVELKDILQSAGKDAFFRFKFFQHELLLEFLKELSQQKGETVDSMLVVVDLQFCQKEDLCTANLTILSELLHLLIDHYPTMIKEIVCINVPELPELLTAQNLFKRDVYNMISVTGRKYTRRLKKKIAITQWPIYLGGKKHCDGTRPYVSLDIEYSVKVPQLILQQDAPNEKLIYTVGPGIRKVEEYHVAAAGSILTWDFDLISSPVNFAIYANSLGQNNRLVHSAGLTLDTDMRSGSLDCKMAGRYLFVVDNKVTTESPVQVSYRVTVVPPDSYVTRLAPMLPLVRQIKQKAPSICRRRDHVTNAFSTPNVDWLNSI
ncbi:putative SEC14-like protein 6 [Biomphalaria glabrata]|uniref:SEC14-like protein 6 n=1 Tax=Biomphalaria glabrata TaxID=6526 RepID=A0A9W2Z4X3_BIOGL|nr:putative SEC14-like protein 6 [Biomphalaria glabrata]